MTNETLIDEPLSVGDVTPIPEELDATLRVVSGPDTGSVVPVKDPITLIGRDEGCHLTLDDPRVSTRHAMVYFSGGEFRVRDLDSTNGTLVNGSRVGRQVLKRDDEIQMGKLRIGVTLPL